MDKISVIYSFARSGGTLVNQLLGVHPTCLVLSEINPAASYKSVTNQAIEWLNLLKAEEESEFSCKDYPDQIRELYKRAMKDKKNLIIRDWVTVNFLPGCAGDLISPSGQLEQEIYLKHAGFETVPLVFTRRSLPIYQSIRENFQHLKNLKPSVFAKSYLHFAQSVSNFTIVHLEDLRAYPGGTLLKILELFDLDAVNLNRILKTFHNYDKCTGNNSLTIPTKSSMARTILSPDTDCSHDNVEDYIHQALHKADSLLGYE
jgi:hypothetical protein